MVRCIVMFLLKWENFTSISLRGFKERCQYLRKEISLVTDTDRRVCAYSVCQTHLHVPTGLGRTTPAV